MMRRASVLAMAVATVLLLCIARAPAPASATDGAALCQSPTPSQEELERMQRLFERRREGRARMYSRGAIILPEEADRWRGPNVRSGMERFFPPSSGFGLKCEFREGILQSQRFVQALDGPYCFGLFIRYQEGRPEEFFWLVTKRWPSYDLWASYDLRLEQDFASEILRALHAGESPSEKLGPVKQQFERGYVSYLQEAQGWRIWKRSPGQESVEFLAYERVGLVLRFEPSESDGSVGLKILTVLSDQLGAARPLKRGDTIVDVEVSEVPQSEGAQAPRLSVLTVERDGERVEIEAANRHRAALLQLWRRQPSYRKDKHVP